MVPSWGSTCLRLAGSHLPLVWLPVTPVFPSTPRNSYTGTEQQVASKKGWLEISKGWGGARQVHGTVPGKNESQARPGLAGPASLMAVACPTQVLSTFALSCPTTPTDPDEQGVLPSRSPRFSGMGGGCVTGHKILKLLVMEAASRASEMEGRERGTEECEKMEGTLDKRPQEVPQGRGSGSSLELTTISFTTISSATTFLA